MNWSNQNLSHVHLDIFNMTHSVDKKWNQLRNAALSLVNNTCQSCGGHYDKFLHCVKPDSQTKNLSYTPDNLTILCRLCYMISHANCFLNSNSMILCWSQLDQIDIIRNTVDFVINKSYVPSIQDIDPDAKIIDMSILEFVNIQNNITDIFKVNHLHDYFDKYKVFFTESLDINFIDASFTRSMFRDDCSDYHINNTTNEIEHYSFSKSEKKLFDVYFK